MRSRQTVSAVEDTVRSLLKQCCDRIANIDSHQRRSLPHCGQKSHFEGLERRTLFGIGPEFQGPSWYLLDDCPPTGPVASGDANANAGGGTTVTAAPVSNAYGLPIVHSTDLVSNAFGMPWGHTRSWVGFNESSRNGNGWMVTEQPFLAITRSNVSPHTAILTVVLSGSAGEQFEADISGNYFNRNYGKSTLTYTPPTASPNIPGEFTYTDARGNVTKFHDLPHYISGSSGSYTASINGGEGYHLQDTNQWYSTSTGLGTSVDTYQFGAFKSYTDASGTLRITNELTYVSGNLTAQTITRTDGSGAFERFEYEYSQVENTETDASAYLLEKVTLTKATGSPGYTPPGSGWTDVRSAEYAYYTGMSTDDAGNGRLGDLKLVTIVDYQRNGSGDVVDEKYYRYNKFHGQTASGGGYDSRGPTNMMSDSNDNAVSSLGTGGSDTEFAAVGLDNLVWSGLKAVVEGASFARLKAYEASYESVPNNDTVTGSDDNGDGDPTNDDITAYADHFFWYERYDAGEVEYPIFPDETRYRVIQETAIADGCSTCASGVGTYRYDYDSIVDFGYASTDQLANPKGNDNGTASSTTWVVRTKEYLPDTTNTDANSDGIVDDSSWLDNDQSVVLTNQAGQTLLQVIRNGVTSVAVSSVNTSGDASGRTTIHATGHSFKIGDLVDFEDIFFITYNGGFAYPGQDFYGAFRVAAVSTNSFEIETPYTNETSVTLGSNPRAYRATATYHHYDVDGRLLATAHDSAIRGFNLLYEKLNDYADPLVVNSDYFFDNSGRIDLFTYGENTDTLLSDGTDATEHSGEVEGYLSTVETKKGFAGTPVLLSSQTYYKHTAQGVETYPIATRTSYWDVDADGVDESGDKAVTKFEYQWLVISSTETQRIESMRRYLPDVDTSRNGWGDSTDYVEAYYDAQGRMTWQKDAEGSISFTEYDPATGGVITRIVDVDTDNTGDFSNKPSTFSNSSGLHLLSSFEVDNLGRVTKSTDPLDNVTFTVFIDVSREVRTYRGWYLNDNGTPGTGGDDYYTTTGPIVVRRQDWSNQYDEVMTYTAVPSESGGAPTGTESPATIHSLTRQIRNNAGQIVEVDQYFSLSGATYTPTAAVLTSATANDHSISGNYHRTYRDYDGRGRPKRSETSAGTVTRYIYDERNHLTQVWIGTDDDPVSANWTPAYELNPSNTDTNLVLVEERSYDGNGNLVKVIRQPDGDATTSSTDRVTINAYDWRDRLVATKNADQGGGGGESTSINRQLTYYEYDNQNRVVAVSTYDADQLAFADGNSDGVPDAPSSSLLRTRTETRFDDRGRVYSSAQNHVDPSNGSISSTQKLISSFWYDDRNQVVKHSSPGNASVKTAYDGASRVMASYITDAGADSSVSGADAPDTLVGDKVLEQTEYLYDDNGNVLIMTHRQRFHDASATGVLGNPASTSEPKARVYYTASYYDRLDRPTRSINVGTNGGTAYTTSDRTTDTAASRSNTKLITDYTYDDAGRLWRVHNPRNIEARTYYDLLGRKIKTVYAYVDGNVSDGDDRTTMYTYTGAGNIRTLRAMLPDGTDGDTLGGHQETEYVYGTTPSDGSTFYSNELLKEVRYPTKSVGSGNLDAFGADAGEADAYAYNALGEKILMTDRRGVEHTYAYDLVGRMTSDKITDFGGSGIVDTTVDEIQYAFDSAGRAWKVLSRSTANGILNEVRYAYNGFGQITIEYQEHDGGVSLGTTQKTQYAYSEGASGVNHSRLTGMTYPSGYVVSYNYGLGDLNDAISRLASLSDSGGTLETYAYLGTGIYAEIDRPQPGTTLTYIAGTAGDAGDQYAGLDRFGRIYDQHWTDGTDALDRTQYSYDRNGNRYKKNVVTDANTPPSTGANQVDEQFVYDKLDRLIEARRGTINTSNNPSSMDTVAWLAGWSLDTLGNIKGYGTVNDPSFGDADLDGDVDFDDLLVVYQNYNDEYQLWAEADFDGDGTVDFDDLLITNQQFTSDFTGGNAISTQSRGHNGQNQIDWMDDDNDGVLDSGEELEYDDAGSNTTDQDGRTLVYDGWNRQVSITDIDGTTLINSYVYDGLSRQVFVGDVEQFFNLGWQLVYERNSADDVTARYVWSPVYVDALVLRDMDINADTDYSDTNERVYSQWDANFNVTSITNASGTVLERYRFEPYGARTVLNADFSVDTLAGSDGTTSDDSTAGWNTSDVLFRNGHQGGMYDAVVQEKVQFRFRPLDVEQMRWGRVDPLMYIDGPNFYQSFSTNPSNYVDPTGTTLKAATAADANWLLDRLWFLTDGAGEWYIDAAGNVVPKNPDFCKPYKPGSGCKGPSGGGAARSKRPTLTQCICDAINSTNTLPVHRTTTPPTFPAGPGGAANTTGTTRNIKVGGARPNGYPGWYPGQSNGTFPGSPFPTQPANTVPATEDVILAHELCGHAVPGLPHPPSPPAGPGYTGEDPVIKIENRIRMELGPEYGVRR